MEVIVQQAIVVQPQVAAVAVPSQQVQEMAGVLVIVEDGLAGVVAVEDVTTGSIGVLVVASGTGNAAGPPPGCWSPKWNGALSRVCRLLLWFLQRQQKALRIGRKPDPVLRSPAAKPPTQTGTEGHGVSACVTNEVELSP